LETRIPVKITEQNRERTIWYFSEGQEVLDRLENVITNCNESYIEGIQADHVTDIGVKTQTRLIELEDSLEESLS